MDKAEEVRAILGSKYSEYTDFAPVKYSLNELIALADEYRAILTDNGFRVIETGTREQENRVVIGVLSDEVEAASAFIEECGDLPITVFETSEWTQ